MSAIVGKFCRMVDRGELAEGQLFESIDMLNESPAMFPTVLKFFTQTFKEGSSRARIAIQILDHLVKNCKIAFHRAANRDQPFLESLLSLLKYRRKEAGLLSSIKRNKANWQYIEEKTLFIIQLWYDAFMLEEHQYANLISLYKILRKEAVEFPPRPPNQKALIAVETQSPIFQNLAGLQSQERPRRKSPPRKVMVDEADLLNEEAKTLKALLSRFEKQPVTEPGSLRMLADRLSEQRKIVYSHSIHATLNQTQKQDIRLLLCLADSLAEKCEADLLQLSRNKDREFQQARRQKAGLKKYQTLFRQALQDTPQASVSIQAPRQDSLL